jgi:hypothetical protein
MPVNHSTSRVKVRTSPHLTAPHYALRAWHQAYLDEQGERAAMHVEAASRKLREQTADLQTLLNTTPAAALTDMTR